MSSNRASGRGKRGQWAWQTGKDSEGELKVADLQLVKAAALSVLGCRLVKVLFALQGANLVSGVVGKSPVQLAHGVDFDNGRGRGRGASSNGVDGGRVGGVAQAGEGVAITDVEVPVRRGHAHRVRAPALAFPVAADADADHEHARHAQPDPEQQVHVQFGGLHACDGHNNTFDESNWATWISQLRQV